MGLIYNLHNKFLSTLSDEYKKLGDLILVEIAKLPIFSVKGSPVITLGGGSGGYFDITEYPSSDVFAITVLSADELNTLYNLHGSNRFSENKVTRISNELLDGIRVTPLLVEVIDDISNSVDSFSYLYSNLSYSLISCLDFVSPLYLKRQNDLSDSFSNEINLLMKIKPKDGTGADIISSSSIGFSVVEYNDNTKFKREYSGLGNKISKKFYLEGVVEPTELKFFVRKRFNHLIDCFYNQVIMSGLSDTFIQDEYFVFQESFPSVVDNLFSELSNPSNKFLEVTNVNYTLRIAGTDVPISTLYETTEDLYDYILSQLPDPSVIQFLGRLNSNIYFSILPPAEQEVIGSCSPSPTKWEWSINPNDVYAIFLHFSSGYYYNPYLNSVEEFTGMKHHYTIPSPRTLQDQILFTPRTLYGICTNRRLGDPYTSSFKRSDSTLKKLFYEFSTKDYQCQKTNLIELLDDPNANDFNKYTLVYSIPKKFTNSDISKELLVIKDYPTKYYLVSPREFIAAYSYPNSFGNSYPLEFRANESFDDKYYMAVASPIDDKIEAIQPATSLRGFTNYSLAHWDYICTSRVLPEFETSFLDGTNASHPGYNMVVTLYNNPDSLLKQVNSISLVNASTGEVYFRNSKCQVFNKQSDGTFDSVGTGVPTVRVVREHLLDSNNTPYERPIFIYPFNKVNSTSELEPGRETNYCLGCQFFYFYLNDIRYQSSSIPFFYFQTIPSGTEINTTYIDNNFVCYWDNITFFELDSLGRLRVRSGFVGKKPRVITAYDRNHLPYNDYLFYAPNSNIFYLIPKNFSTSLNKRFVSLQVGNDLNSAHLSFNHDIEICSAVTTSSLVSGYDLSVYTRLSQDFNTSLFCNFDSEYKIFPLESGQTHVRLVSYIGKMLSESDNNPTLTKGDCELDNSFYRKDYNTVENLDYITQQHDDKLARFVKPNDIYDDNVGEFQTVAYNPKVAYQSSAEKPEVVDLDPEIQKQLQETITPVDY